MMKKYLIKPVILSVVLFASAKIYGAEYSLPPPDEHTLKPASCTKKLDRVSLKILNRPDIQGGFLIDAQGINYPAVQQLGASTRLWLFPSSLKTFFNARNQLMVNDYDGRVYQLTDSNWMLSAIKLKPRSRVLLSTDDIIACTEPSPTKANNEPGECYAVAANWAVNYGLQAIKPDACKGKLYIPIQTNKKLSINEIDLKTGALVKTLKYKKSAKSICDTATG